MDVLTLVAIGIGIIFIIAGIVVGNIIYKYREENPS